MNSSLQCKNLQLAAFISYVVSRVTPMSEVTPIYLTYFSL